MLSAIKNFFLTFIIALLIFSLVAYLAVNLVINNINGALDSKTTEAVTTAGPGRAEPVPGTDDESDGESVNILIVGCDYRGGVFADYDSKVIEERFGVVREYPVMRPVPNDLGMPAPSGVISDSGVEPLDGVTTGAPSGTASTGSRTGPSRPIPSCCSASTRSAGT